MNAGQPAALRPGARIDIVGGGPGGLFLAILLRKARPDWNVVVYERNPRGVVYGFGVVFTVRTVQGLYKAAPEVIDEVTESFQTWTDIEVGIPAGVARTGGHHFSAVERYRLLEILAAHAEAAGVDIRFESEITDIAAMKDEADLLVGADGLNSLVRTQWEDQFGLSVHQGSSVFAWFATPRRYDALTFHFVETEHGVFSTHAYPFSDDLSTFIVETDEATWRKAGLDVLENNPPPPGQNDELGLQYCQEIFAESLQGHELVGNNSRWLRFPTVRNSSWTAADNVVILGDAAHTAHFSVGSGTKMAMEDATALVEALTSESSLGEALTKYDEIQRPRVARIQNAAEPSRGWWEGFGDWTHRDVTTFAVNFLTRTGAELLDSLFKRDADFAADHTRPDVLADEVLVGDVRCANRLAVLVDSSLAAKATDGQFEQPAGLAIIDSACATSLGDGLAGTVAALQQSGAVVALEAKDAAGADLKIVSAGASVPSSDVPVIARIQTPTDAGDHDAHAAACARASELADAGAAALWLSPTPDPDAGRDGLVVACNRIRAAVDVPLIVSGVQSTMDAATFVSAARADVCVGLADQLDLSWAD